ncbi:hypothetical protein MKEN_00683600 [Mycena kentingensis (nom. inval.)]|nr:hypothetical protein MKEN_00683600 [Mycena kentingensis (nom. inval.)]
MSPVERMSIPKFASLLITLVGGLVHSFLALQLTAAWHTLRSIETETEYENAWRFDGLRVLWALLALYLLAAAFVSFVGLSGVLRNNATHVRLYRDCASADLLFTTFLGIVAAFAAWGPALTSSRAACDSPELAPLLPLIGALLAPFLPAPLALDEACERYLAHVGAGAAAGLLVLSVVRVHFLLAVNTHYATLRKAESDMEIDVSGATNGVQRIRLLPLPRGVSPTDVVYAPVHVPSNVTASSETWVRLATPSSSPTPTGYAPAYVRSAPQDVEADAGLLDVSVVRTKREWI